MQHRFSVISDAVGFALMKMPATLHAAYEQHAAQRDTWSALQQLRATLKNIDPAEYRGIERCPLAEDPLIEPWFAGDERRYRALDERDVAARVRFVDIVGADDLTDKSSCVVLTLDYARELIRLVDSPAEYEIVRLAKALPESPRSQSHLGFDIGYWGGDSYSIICDSAIWPVWHGPPTDVFAELSDRLRELNTHCLFPTYESAQRFRSWYCTQDWAEIEGEPGEFCIISIEAIDEATRNA
jgi:hypothetical protein